ncbi:hypothetical protein BX666DRAFT_168853 [Dichotomocladium elegans]|nr:hypothetical protein BX666DRAFT_168853 [Dichotomocladium elegans]
MKPDHPETVLTAAQQALRRREQNRQAQQALRKRREQRIRSLENEIKMMASTHAQILTEIQQENESLKTTIQQLQCELGMTSSSPNRAMKRPPRDMATCISCGANLAQPGQNNPSTPLFEVSRTMPASQLLFHDDHLVTVNFGEFAQHKTGQQQHHKLVTYPTARITNPIEAWEYVRERYDVEEAYNSGFCDAFMTRIIEGGVEEAEFDRMLRQWLNEYRRKKKL